MWQIWWFDTCLYIGNLHSTQFKDDISASWLSRLQTNINILAMSTDHCVLSRINTKNIVIIIFIVTLTKYLAPSAWGRINLSHGFTGLSPSKADSQEKHHHRRCGWALLLLSCEWKAENRESSGELTGEADCRRLQGIPPVTCLPPLGPTF